VYSSFQSKIISINQFDIIVHTLPYSPTQHHFSELGPDATAVVDKIADRLGLEKIGWIFTGFARDELLNSQEVIEIGEIYSRFNLIAQNFIGLN
jgi:hypothetical protein